MLYNPHNYQVFAEQHIIDHTGCGLFMDMGLGKTVATASAINQLMYDYIEISKPLIIAPKLVAENTWSDEIQKWDHLKHLTVSKILGTERQRKEALLKKADIYIINVENVAWLIAHYAGAFPFDMLVFDEISKFKNPKSLRFKAIRTVLPKIKRVVGLTGTPAPNGLIDLWAPLYLLDQGERLGKTLTSYRETYFNEGARNGHIVYNYKLKKGYEQKIYDKIGDICISMKAKDYLKLPGRIENKIMITLPAAIKAQYDEFEKKQILALDDKEDITVLNAVGLTNKLLQFANGAVYDDKKLWHEVHKEKLQQLDEIMEAANGQPVLVFYAFQSDVARITEYFKKYSPQMLNKKGNFKRWNDGEIEMCLAHPASAGHGLNMQAGGHIVVWFGSHWSLENDMQGISRLDRQGQLEVVINNRLMIRGTMDEDVVAALELKNGGQEMLLAAVKARITKYRKMAA